jgi:uncharacterized membrane protein YidH (DUF202 family)
LANERTFLAWIRTSIGIMAFGFVVEKFALFVRRMSVFLMQAEGHGQQQALSRSTVHSLSQSPGYSTLFGSCLVGLGAFMGILAFVRFKRVEKQLDTDTYHPSLILDIMLVISILIVGIFLAIYMVHTF